MADGQIHNREGKRLERAAFLLSVQDVYETSCGQIVRVPVEWLLRARAGVIP